MANMVGIGPFITIPLIVGAMGGPQCMLGWLVAMVVAVCDGQVWSELSAAMPGEGGSYVYLREAFSPFVGRLAAFLFIWQMMLSGPLEVASGNIGLAGYLGFLHPALAQPGVVKAMAVGTAVITVLLHYRRIGSVAKIAVALWVGMLLTVGWTIFTGLTHFNAQQAFSFPPGAFNFSWGFVAGLGSASLIAMYDYLGYYNVCYVGEEVKDPGRVLPRAIIISVVAVALLYMAVNLSMIGVIPWQDILRPQIKDHVASIMIQRAYGWWPAVIITLMIAYTAFGSIYALMIGYSRLPFAAARDGNFFRYFAAIHPTRHIPHRSLFLVGGMVAIGSLFDLGLVINACLSARLVVQFIGQIVALSVLRRIRPDLPRPFRMWLYPIPSIIAFVGFAYIWLFSGKESIILGTAWTLLGVLAFLIWARVERQWPFGPKPAPKNETIGVRPQLSHF